MRLYRRLLRLRADDHVTDFDVLCLTGLPAPQELLRSTRLRYLGTLHKCGMEVAWGLLRADDAWQEQIKQDIQWVWQ